MNTDLIYSGNDYEADRQKELAAGANEYLTKPYMGDLAAALRQNIEQTNKTARQIENIKEQVDDRSTCSFMF
jgi:DNA-binding response OmpR family regulator